MVGSLSLVAAGCGSSASEPTAQKETTTKGVEEESGKSTQEGGVKERIKKAEEAVASAKKMVATSNNDLKIKRKALEKAKSELKKLQESNITKNDTENSSLEGLQVEAKRLNDLLASHREKLIAEVNEVEIQVGEASEGIANSEEEFQKLPVFGDVHTTSEVLLYVFGFK